MQEIIQIQIGAAGNRIGTQQMELTCHEHCIDESGHYYGDSDCQLERIGTYFNETN